MKTYRLIIAFTMILSGMLLAQEPPMLGPGAGARLEQFKKIRMMEELRLNEETSIRFFARYNKHQEEMKKLNEKKNDAINQLERLYKGDGADAEYEKVFKELFDLEKNTRELREKYLDDLKEVLTRKQIAQYLVFERNFYQNLREIARDLQRQRMGPGR